MRDWKTIVAIAIISLVIIQSLILSIPKEQTISCGDGTIEIDGICVLADDRNTGEAVELSIDFLEDEFVVTRDDVVRLVFDRENYDHYIPNSFELDSFEVQVDLENERYVVYEFVATKVGEFNYSSEGLCRVEIPGAGEVEVDCAIYCGETENGRTGTIIVEPEYTIKGYTADDVGFQICALLPEYCGAEEFLHSGH